MSGCTCENWTIADLASALQNMHKDNKIIAVPMFQRGKRWNKGQQQIFIDSIIKGYPVGTMLFYETIDNSQQTYILVDGLQRGNSIKMYMNNPTDFFYDSSISDELCANILNIVHCNETENYPVIRSTLTTFIKNQKSFNNLQYYEPAKEITEKFSNGSESVGELINVIAKFFEDRQSLYNQIALTPIPVIVYHGDESNLPEIFDRINSKGTPLDQYEVYAASWPVNHRFKIGNNVIIESAIKKYDSFIADGYIIHGYDRENFRASKNVNAFEYLFGLSKYLVEKFDILSFNKTLADDTVNPLGFELVNACLNDTDRIRSLYKNIYDIKNIDLFETALFNSIQFVVDSISAITKFKGNSHSGIKRFHSKYQILSMISTTFKEMYEGTDYTRLSDGWESKKDYLITNLRLYYVYDIITNYWSEGGTSKIYSAAKPNRYMVEISPRAWRAALDGFFEKSMFRTESKQIPNPKSEELVFLNCIYLNTFTAADQLSIDKFDVEHIAPKEQMKKIIAKCNGAGLPISCIANLCYLPEYVNRSKRDKNFYQDTKYLQHIDLADVERKFSFTTSDDLEWMDMPYEKAADFDLLKQSYTDFCTSRFAVLKKLFCESLKIDYDSMISSKEDAELADTASESPTSSTPSHAATMKFTAECIKRVEESIGETLHKLGRVVYITADNKKGYVFSSSKAYRQGNRNKYWYAYRRGPLDDISECEEKYLVYGCKDDKEVLIIPVDIMEERTEKMNFSLGDDGTISHWHIVIFRDSGGHITQLLSRPALEEVDVDKYKV